MPDPSILLSFQLPENEPGRLDKSYNANKSLSNVERPRLYSGEGLVLEEDDLELDLGEDPVDPKNERSIEIPRRDSGVLGTDVSLGDDNLNLMNDDLNIDLRDDPASMIDIGLEKQTSVGLGEISMGDVGSIDIRDRKDTADAPASSYVDWARRDNHSQTSSLSSLRSSVEPVFKNATDGTEGTYTNELQCHPVCLNPSRNNKKRKVLLTDADTMIQQNQIKAQQAEHSNILSPAKFLPRDSTLLSLMHMQTNGNFVSNVLNDGRSRGWAPELRRVFSVEVIRRAGLKRKRNHGIALADGVIMHDKIAQSDLVLAVHDENANGTNIVNVDEETKSETLPDNLRNESSFNDGHQALTTHDDIHLYEEGELEAETATSLTHYIADDIATGTKDAMRLFREKLGNVHSRPTNKQYSSMAFLHEILPERYTNRTEATKVFFEVLVLATKDILRVEQMTDKLGKSICIHEKDGL